MYALYSNHAHRSVCIENATIFLPHEKLSRLPIPMNVPLKSRSLSTTTSLPLKSCLTPPSWTSTPLKNCMLALMPIPTSRIARNPPTRLPLNSSWPKSITKRKSLPCVSLVRLQRRRQTLIRRSFSPLSQFFLILANLVYLGHLSGEGPNSREKSDYNRFSKFGVEPLALPSVSFFFSALIDATVHLLT